MKFIITTPDGTKKTRESNNQEEIKILLRRGWKEVSPKVDDGKLIKNKIKKNLKKKSN